MDDVLVDYFADSVKPLAMVFSTFNTTHRTYDTVEQLLAEYGVSASNKVELVVPGDSHLQVIEVYYGNRWSTDLANFLGFINFNGLETQNGATYRWAYDVIVAVGRLRVGSVDIPVDIPAHMFPFSTVPFSLVDSPDIFNVGVPAVHPVLHTLVRRCSSCATRKRSCLAVPGMTCQNCAPGTCRPQEGEENGRAQMFYDATAAVSYALSPPYQHLIQSVKAAVGSNKEPKIPHHVRCFLKGLVQDRHVTGPRPATSEVLKSNCAAVQVVRFQNGTMSRVYERGVEQLFGFEDYEGCRLSKVRVAAATPHLGLARAEKSYSLIDAALSRQGEIFFFEDQIMYKRGPREYGFKMARLYLTASVIAEDDMIFTLGWTF
jgi:hypothetical protein